MTNEYDVMPYDATLLSSILAQHEVTVGALAMRSGYDDKSIYRYLSGERTVPSVVLRAAFELTADPRLIALIAGAVPVQVLSGQSLCVPPMEQLVPKVSEAAKSAVDALQYVARILADGQIDDTDAAAISNFRRHAANCNRLLVLCDAAVAAHVKSAGGKAS